MQGVPRTWELVFEVSSRCELTTASIFHIDAGGKRQIVVWNAGPFDSPDEILAVMIEMIEQAEWKGEQLRLPEPTLSE